MTRDEAYERCLKGRTWSFTAASGSSSHSPRCSNLRFLFACLRAAVRRGLDFRPVAGMP